MEPKLISLAKKKLYFLYLKLSYQKQHRLFTFSRELCARRQTLSTQNRYPLLDSTNYPAPTKYYGDIKR